MPFYDFHCDACDTTVELRLSMDVCGEPQKCNSCGEQLRKCIAMVNFNLPGDDWASKNGRVAKQRAESRAKAGAKQAERKREAPGVKLVPNVAGERVGSWAEAQRLAASSGKNASSYDALVKTEKTTIQ
jgi:putative FmdB family regulatory protein